MRVRARKRKKEREIKQARESEEGYQEIKKRDKVKESER